jgi:DNA-directed RNA polymerase subunit RPC12/RpoP
VNEEVRAEDERRGSMCPACKSVRGLPTANIASPGLKTISYRCPMCSRIWDYAYPQTPDRLTGR